ncbi:hypothetical protein FBEOM_11744 [Fusarium beomiforme]|uniref:Uncharacterized protein n=1 Tax=Fusarium beomiforme TaxID=44412 RepID=A0A9P5AA45_9HYPO|nr:hypothetical protein FBEOM_11744 [Fusarium beomiforme]
MGSFNASLVFDVRESPARETVLKDPQEVFKAFVALEGCSWIEKYLRNIEFNTLGISKAHVLENTSQKHMSTFSIEKESTYLDRRPISQPDFLYGWIPSQSLIDRIGIPRWLMLEAEAIEGTGLFYPFLVVKLCSATDGQSKPFNEAIRHCFAGAFIRVRMVENLRHRLVERGYSDAGALLGLNSSVFSFFMLENNQACITFTYAWDETSEKVCYLGNFDLAHEEGQRECEE